MPGTPSGADGPTDPEALVGQTVVAVVAVQGLDSFPGEIGEDLFVGRSGLVVADRGAVGAPTMSCTTSGDERGEHAVDVVGHLEGEMAVHELVHLGWSQ